MSTFSRALLPSLIALASVAAGAVVYADESLGDLRDQRERAREAAAAAVAELELLEAEDAEVAAALAEMQAAVDAQLARVEGARQALAAAEAEVEARAGAVVRARAEIAALERDVAGRVVDAFVGTDRTTTAWLGTGDLNRATVRLALIDLAAGNDRDSFDALRESQAQLELELEAGESAEADAERWRADLEEALVLLEQRRDLQQAVRDEVGERMSEWEAQAAAREREAEEMTELIREAQVEALGFDLGDPGAASVLGFVMPVSGRIGSGFGNRVHPIWGSVRMHSGVDIGGSTGDPVWTSKDGVVIFAGWRGGYGNAVVVQHEGNVATLYAHLSELSVAAGEWVPQGEVIGLMGSTGWSTGPHLHFEVRRDGVPENPELFLPG